MSDGKGYEIGDVVTLPVFWRKPPWWKFWEKPVLITDRKLVITAVCKGGVTEIKPKEE